MKIDASHIFKKLKEPFFYITIAIWFIFNLILFPLGFSSVFLPSNSAFWGIVYDFTGFSFAEAFQLINYPILSLIPIAEYLGLPPIFVIVFFFSYWFGGGCVLGIIVSSLNKVLGTWRHPYSSGNRSE